MDQRILQTLRFVNGHADVWRLFTDRDVLRATVKALTEPYKEDAITSVAGIEARGFILGGACAVALNAGFAAIRKEQGLFPGPKLTATAEADYRGNEHRLRIQLASLSPHDRVLLVDDWCETGSQAHAARSLIERTGATFVGLSCVVDETTAVARERLGKYRWLIRANEIPGN